MVQLNAAFNARNFPPASADGGGNMLPPGEHRVHIVNSEIAPTKDGRSSMFVFHCEVIEGPLRGQSMKYRINIFNESPQARGIAERQLSSLCHVLNTYEVPDTAVLHGKPFIAVVRANPTTDYPNATQISGVKDINGNDPGRAGAGASQPQPQSQPPAQPPQNGSWGGNAGASQPAASTPPASGNWGGAQAGQQPQNGATPAWGGTQQPAQQPSQQPSQQQPGQPPAAWGNSAGPGGPAQPNWVNNR
jgi:hypothetical protein